MTSEWSNTTVGEHFELVPGYAFKSKDFLAAGVPVIKIKNVKAGRIRLHTLSYVSRDFLTTRKDKRISYGDLLVTMSGNRLSGTKETWVGKVARFTAPGEYLLNQRVGILRPLADRAVDVRFCSYVLSSDPYQHRLIAVATSSGGQANLSPGQILGLPLLLPALDEQRRIAAVLGALDDKIELNGKMNRTLEVMAQAIFKSWFIDFDGVSDSEMVESELGPIPKGWEVKPVNDIIQFNPRTKLAKGTLATFADMKALPTTGCSVSGVIKKVMKSGGAKFMQGDTLLARITPCLENGKTALVDFLASGEVAFGSTEFIVMRPTAPFGREWVYCLARSAEFRQHAISNMTGSSGRQRVPVDCFSHFAMPEPPATTAQKFRATTSPFFDRIKANADESRTLAALRDALLPRLISGEIRVPEAEDAVEAVL
jgi:type I restriction enzyme S subunit